MPDSEQKYLFQRLTSGDFQQLVSALLANQYQQFQAMPLGQADGGRDGAIEADPAKRLVFQVKWAKRLEKDPVAWLKTAIDGEAKNLRRLGDEGLRNYVIVTNAPSTGKVGVGTHDRMRQELDKYQADFGIETMECVWQETLNSWVDNAPDEVKWAYADMLAGWDLMRYLVSDFIGKGENTATRKTIRKLAEVHWGDDERVKFGQVDVDRQRVSDLFVDVGARRVSRIPVFRANQYFASVEPAHGVARYLLGTNQPYTLVLGAPGQGKSTLTQFVCQSHRAAFVAEDVHKDGLLPVADGAARFPIRIELGTYAAWLDGEDVFSDAEQTKRGRRKRGSGGSISAFLVEQFRYACGDGNLGHDVVDDILGLVPTLVVFDGLDEVGSAKTRQAVVAEIERFAKAGRSYADRVHIVVTSRPNSSHLAEPDSDLFESLSLQPFDDRQIAEYSRKWCAVNGLRGNEGRKLRRTFQARKSEPYIEELASNPMQLTILLDLINKEGDATPTDRTELYDKYMELLLAREANKHPDSVKRHQKDLREIVPFLGWYVQSRAEEGGSSGRMAKAEILAAMKHFQATYEKDEAIVGELVEAATDRLWALTSKEEGTFEFDIQSLREYFAARFLYDLAGEEVIDFERSEVLRELMLRSYWLNTARFYAGNARGGDVADLAAGVRDELCENPSTQTVVAAWTLLVDGVFNSRPKRAAEVLDALTSDEHMIQLNIALRRSQISPLHVMPGPFEQNATWLRLTQSIARKPGNPVNRDRLHALHNLLPLSAEFDSWWRARLIDFVGTAKELHWLELGAMHASGCGYEDEESLSKIALTGRGAELVLNTGLRAATGGAIETKLIEAVLDGRCTDVFSTMTLPARVAVALAPDLFYATESGFAKENERDYRLDDSRRDAIRGLDRAASPFAAVAKKRRFAKGQSGSTFPWANTATALYAEVGRCWLATEIAVIGAAHPLSLGANRIPDTVAFGETGHPTTLMRDVRANSADWEWWRTQLIAIDADDELGKSEWAFALWATATPDVIAIMLADWETAVSELGSDRRQVLLRAIRRMNHYELLQDRPVRVSGRSRWAQELIRGRAGEAPRRSNTRSQYPKPPEPLAAIARKRRWLLVDSAPRYQ